MVKIVLSVCLFACGRGYLITCHPTYEGGQNLPGTRESVSSRGFDVSCVFCYPTRRTRIDFHMFPRLFTHSYQCPSLELKTGVLNWMGLYRCSFFLSYQSNYPRVELKPGLWCWKEVFSDSLPESSSAPTRCCRGIPELMFATGQDSPQTSSPAQNKKSRCFPWPSRGTEIRSCVANFDVVVFRIESTFPRPYSNSQARWKPWLKAQTSETVLGISIFGRDCPIVNSPRAKLLCVGEKGRCEILDRFFHKVSGEQICSLQIWQFSYAPNHPRSYFMDDTRHPSGMSPAMVATCSVAFGRCSSCLRSTCFVFDFVAL